ncbi:MAG: cation:proton antiporter [Rubricoccaceae bacterium]|nr:cation:proton antiporter [Rubricoccaceae bacterium]
MLLPLAAAVPPFLTDVVALLAVAALVAYVSQRLGLMPIVGFLLAGVLIGPHALGLVQDEAVIEAAAEIGVLLLLFTIGIEFSLAKLAKITRLIFVGGGLQVGLVTAIVTGLLLLFGVDWRVGVFSGFLAALSSTAIVTKLLGDRGETNTAPGQSAVGVLIFQDLAVIVMVLLVPALGGEGGSPLEVVWALGKAALIIALVLVVARRLMPPVLEAVARTCSPELFLLTVIAICFGTAWLVGMAGVSIALGAFLAGLVVSESRFSEHAMSEILPLQILFSATFFVSVGLLLDLGYLLTNLPLVLLIIGIVFALKLVTTGVAVRVAGRAVPVAGAAALLLAQVGEFSFVLERAGREVGLSPMGMGEAGSQTFIAATVILMALTPVLAPWAGRLGQKLEGMMEPTPAADAEPEPSGEHFESLENHVIVAGYGTAARPLVQVLRGSGIPFAIATLSPQGAREAEADGLPVLRGDYAKRHILELLGLQRAKMLVLADDRPQMAHRVTAVARSLSPTTRILTVALTPEEAEELEHAGADRAIAAELETVIGLFDDVLRRYEIAPDEILGHEEALRRGGYVAFERSTDDRPAVTCELSADCFGTRTLTIREGMAVAGKTIGELRLDERLLHVVRIEHDGETVTEPSGDAVLPVGASVTFGGATASFVEAGDLFRVHDLSVPLPDLPEPAAMRADWIDATQPVTLDPDPNAGCTHLDHVHAVTPSAQGCEECLDHGGRWVHLRVCMECGHVGCCDSSPGKHATAHYHATGHPVMRSIERGERWGWCFEDEVML